MTTSFYRPEQQQLDNINTSLLDQYLHISSDMSVRVL